MSQYTVVLEIPRLLWECSSVAEHYVANQIVVPAEFGLSDDRIREAVRLAKQEAWEQLEGQDRKWNSPEDYTMIVVLEGHPEVLAFGWQTVFQDRPQKLRSKR